MRYAISGYTSKLTIIEVDENFKINKRIDRNINSSSFMVLDDYIYCYDRQTNPFVYMLSKDTLEVIDKTLIETENITHLAFSKKNKVLYGCSYVGGSFFGVRVDNNKFGPVINVIKEDDEKLSRCHCLLLNKNEDILVVVNIATDKLNFYSITSNSIDYVKSIELPKGVGPRHAIYNDDESLIYVITEYSNEVIVIDVNLEKVLDRYSTLKSNDIISYGATLFILNNRLYASNRGEETIAVFDIENHGKLNYSNCIPVYGKHSRHMIPSNGYIITCNKNSNNVCFIDINSKKLVFEFSFENPSCVIQID